MRHGAASFVALALLGGCIRERPPGARDAGASEALRASPGHELRHQEIKPDAAVVAVAPPPEPAALTIEEQLRRCDASVRGAVVRVSEDVAYAAETTANGPVIRLVRRAGGEFVCERYEVPAGAPGVAWPGAPSPGRVSLATATDGPVGNGSAVLVELGADGAVRSATVIQGACGAGSTVRAVPLFAGPPAIQVRCWIATDGFFTAADQLFHHDAHGWRTLLYSESGRIARPPTMTAPPANPQLPGSIRVLESGATPRLEVASSSVDVLNGSVKFSRQVLRWNDAERRFEVAATPVIERRGG